ncbi:hypothetical protein GGR57DRAFT_280212 [Xylariaceae sp. FL1272]|nr:hypothetical protein GGR57DRAFT_280212 [Xylariaceae sp. FL1272]
MSVYACQTTPVSSRQAVQLILSVNHTPPQQHPARPLAKCARSFIQLADLPCSSHFILPNVNLSNHRNSNQCLPAIALFNRTFQAKDLLDRRTFRVSDFRYVTTSNGSSIRHVYRTVPDYPDRIATGSDQSQLPTTPAITSISFSHSSIYFHRCSRSLRILPSPFHSLYRLFHADRHPCCRPTAVSIRLFDNSGHTASRDSLYLLHA